MYHVYVKCRQRTIINNNIDDQMCILLAVATSVNVKEAPIHWVSIGVLAEIKFATGYLLLGTWQMEDYVQSSFS